jgi:hypothetical protein
MPVEKVWRWWDEAPSSTVLKEASAKEYLLRLAEYAREFYGLTKKHPPVGFLLKPDGGVCVVPDLEDLPQMAWGPALVALSAQESAEYHAVVCEATVAVMRSTEEAAAMARSSTSVAEMKGAREGILVILRTTDAETRQMFFMPRISPTELGEIESPTDGIEAVN